jgi:hypothetical protein
MRCQDELVSIGRIKPGVMDDRQFAALLIQRHFYTNAVSIVAKIA